MSTKIFEEIADNIQTLAVKLALEFGMDVPYDVCVKKSAVPHHVMVRNAAIKVMMNNYQSLTLQVIGKLFGNRHHSTIIHAKEYHEESYNSNYFPKGATKPYKRFFDELTLKYAELAHADRCKFMANPETEGYYCFDGKLTEDLIKASEKVTQKKDELSKVARDYNNAVQEYNNIFKLIKVKLTKTTLSVSRLMN